MAKNAAKEEELGTLHSLLSKQLRIKLGAKNCDPRYFQIATKFLNDNKIYQIPDLTNELGELDKDLQKRKRRFGTENITELATERAKKEAEG